MPPLSSSARAELRALCAEASKDAGVLNAPELRDLRDLMVKLGAKIPAPAAPAAPAAPSGNEDLRDDACVAADVASQEMGPASADEEPSEEARLRAAHALCVGYYTSSGLDQAQPVRV
jgi:hypothetical protein